MDIFEKAFNLQKAHTYRREINLGESGRRDIRHYLTYISSLSKKNYKIHIRTSAKLFITLSFMN